MLQDILQEIEKSHGVISLTALSGKLNIQRSALQGILQFWVRKGKIQIIHNPLQDRTLLCVHVACNKGKCNSCQLAAKEKLIY